MFLDLRSNNLIGTIPTAFGGAGALRNLLLGFNDLTGTIPAALGNLSNLQGLGFRQNRLSGPIPLSLGNLTQLTYLNLRNAGLSGTIPPIFSRMNALVTLDLSENAFTGVIPSQLGDAESLNNLFLGGNQLVGTIPASFGKIKSLELFDASENELSGEIPPVLFANTALKVLSLQKNKLSSILNPQPEFDPAWCSPHGYSLSEVDLSNNQMTGSPQFFRYYSQLTTLNLGHNEMDGALTLQFIHAVGDSYACTFTEGGQLADLVVSDNAFSSIGALPSTIKVLRAPKNQLRGGANHLGNLQSVYFLDLQDNPLLVGDLPPEIIQSVGIKYLFMSNTGLRSSGGDQLPQGWQFETTVLTSFISDAGTDRTWVQCPTVVSQASPNLYISMDPSYYSYSMCSCGQGWAGKGPTCESCPLGYYNPSAQATACHACPSETYTPVKGSVTCESCDLPFKLSYRNQSACLNLLPFYVSFTVVLLLLGLPALILTVIALAFVVSISSRRLTRYVAYLRLKRSTLLIERRALKEIPADLLIHYKDLSLEKTVGVGSFARVFKGYWKRTLVAVKELTGVHSLMASLAASQGGAQPGEEILKADADVQRLVAEFRSEVLVMSNLSHPNVVLLVGACSEFPNLCVVTEYVSGGSLYDTLHSKHAKHSIVTHQQMLWLCETAAGMAYLHSQGVMHRDLKSPNVLLDAQHRAKLCDFGLALVLADTQRTMTNGVGSALWMAPEVILRAQYSFSADVYAWGILAWEIMSPGEVLYASLSMFEISKNVVNGRRPQQHPSWSVCVCSVMSQCWREVAENRPSFDDVVTQLKTVININPERYDDDLSQTRKKDDFDLAVPLLGDG